MVYVKMKNNCGYAASAEGAYVFLTLNRKLMNGALAQIWESATFALLRSWVRIPQAPHRGYNMRNKPREEWHNFDFSQERRLGEIEVAISFNREVLKKFLEYSKDRVDRNTGLRFKMSMAGATEIVHKYMDGKDRFSVQAFALEPYVFPNESAHTDRYDSRYCRVEFYIPMDRLE